MTTRPARPPRALLAVPLAAGLLVAGCGGDTPAAAPSSTPSSTSSSAAPAGGAASTTLLGVVGQGDAFTISLKDAAGAPVTTLRAGTYQVKVTDASAIHNFHLRGPGVEQRTSVPDKGDTTWTVTLAAGTYTYRCDPHPSMTGSITVS